MAVVWPSKNNFANGDVLTAANMNNIADTLNVFNPTSATNGQILTANGSGSVSYQTLVSGGYTQLATGSMNGSSSISVTGLTLTNYKLVQVVINGATTGSGKYITIQGTTTSNYQSFNYNSNNVGTNNASTTVWQTSNSAVDTPNVVFLIFGAGASTDKQMLGRADTGAVSGTMFYFHGMADATAAWTSFVISNSATANFTGGTYTIWGVS